MCWIAKKPAGKIIPQEYIDQANIRNDDGYGLAYEEDGKLEVFKTLSYIEFLAKLSELDDKEVVVHLRAASVGDVNEANIHPFKVGDGVMFHNGTISSLRPSWTTSTASCDETSDTARMAEMLDSCKYESIEDIEPLVYHIIGDTLNRLVFMEPGKETKILNKDLGIEEDGLWYSNDYHVKPKEVLTKVFVYGTLKKGYGNHVLLSGSTYLGKATTNQKMVMIGEGFGFPYLLGFAYEFPEKTGAAEVEGEVYLVNEETLASLDRLEGVPYHYQQRQTAVTDEDGIVHFVKVYIKTHVTESDFQNKLISVWDEKKYDGIWADIEDDATPPLKDVITSYVFEDLDGNQTTYEIYSDAKIEAMSDIELEATYKHYCLGVYGVEQPDYLQPRNKIEMLQEVKELRTDLILIGEA